MTIKFIALVACALVGGEEIDGQSRGAQLSLVPGDNSYYVEGKSRYIWMPDGMSVPRLVDLYVGPSGNFERTAATADSQYWLYTRKNPNSAQTIINGNVKSLQSSNYRSDRPLKVIVHGWLSNGNSAMNPQITTAFLAVQDCNVIVVDWSHVSYNLYQFAVYHVPEIGKFLGEFLVWLINTVSGDWNKVHLIGFSLGAHVVGNAGRTTGSRPSRVTGLDPAGPLWKHNPKALNINDGQHVETINTDGGRLGIFNPIGDANFYPNGGRSQPGCWLQTCSHLRAPELFASSVLIDHFAGKRCANIDKVSDPKHCTGQILMMGNSMLTKNGSGIYGLTTSSVWPF